MRSSHVRPHVSNVGHSIVVAFLEGRVLGPQYSP